MQFLKKKTTKDRYGNETTYEFENQVKPLDQTEIMKMMMEQGVPQMPQGIPQMPIQQQGQQGHPGGPKGTDTVPAWLTPGEFVMNAKAVDKFGPQIEAMNNEGREEQSAQVPQMGGQEAQYHADGGEVVDDYKSYRPLAVAVRAADNLGLMDGVKERADAGIYGHVPFALQAAKWLFGPDKESQASADGREVQPEHTPDKDEISRYRAALATASGNGSSSAAVHAAFEDGEFRNAVAPEVQYEVPSMLDRVPQDPSQAKSFTNIGEEAIGPIPTVPAQAEVPTDFGFGNIFGNISASLKDSGNRKDAYNARQPEAPNKPEVPTTSSATSIPEGGDEYGSMNSDKLVDADRNTVAARAVNKLSGDLSNDYNSVSNFVSNAWRNNPFSWNKTADEGAAAKEELKSRFRAGRLSEEGYDLALAQINEEIAAGEVRTAGNLKADQNKVEEAANREAFLSANTEEPIAEVPPANVSPDGVPPVNKPPVVLTKPEDTGFTPYDKNLDLESEVNDVDKAVNSNPKSVQKKGESLGKKTDKDGVTWYDKAYDSIGGALGNLIDSDRLAEATVMYLGSRAMGYGHAGSLGFVSKQYLGGIKADQAAVRAAAADKSKRGLDMKDFRDKEIIKAKIANGQVKVNRTENIKIKSPDGKVHSVNTAVVNGNTVYVKAGTSDVLNTEDWITNPADVPTTDAYRARVLRATKEYMPSFKALQKNLDSYEGGEDGKDTKHFTGIIPEMAAGEAVRWAIENRVPQEEISDLLHSSYTDAINFAKASNKTPNSITPFLNQLIVRQGAGSAADLFQIEKDGNKTPKYIDASKLYAINSTIAKSIKDSDDHKHRSITDVANVFYGNEVPKWRALGPEVQKKWENLANDGENGFYVYIASQIGLDERKVK